MCVCAFTVSQKISNEHIGFHFFYSLKSEPAHCARRMNEKKTSWAAFFWFGNFYSFERTKNVGM